MRAADPRVQFLAIGLMALLPVLNVPKASRQASAQATSTPKFAVVSIKPLAPNQVTARSPGSAFKPGGAYSNPDVTIYGLLIAAYRLPAYRFDLRALPDWAKTARYAIDARSAPDFPNLPSAENVRQISLMLQAMLADRFQLKLHHETRQTPAYVMTLAKGTLKNATRGDASQTVGSTPGGIAYAIGPDWVLLRGRNATMGELSLPIGAMLERPVIDKTGLSGVYDFNVRWQSPDPEATLPAGGGCGPNCQSLVIGALTGGLGLKLRATTAPMDVPVLDQIEKPSAN